MTHLWLGTKADNTHDMMAKGRDRHHISPTGEDNPCAKLTWKQVREMRNLHATGDYTITSLVKRYRSSLANVWRIVHHLNWKETKESLCQ